MDDRGEPAKNDKLDILSCKRSTNLNGIKLHSGGETSTNLTRALRSINVLVTSTMCRTRSSTDMRSCRRICLMSTPRLSSITGNGSTPAVYDHVSKVCLMTIVEPAQYGDLDRLVELETGLFREDAGHHERFADPLD